MDSSEAESGRTEKIRAAVTAAIVALLAIAVFWPATGHAFVVLDDPDYVTANPHVARGVTVDGLRFSLEAGHAGNWHPVTWWSHMLDVALFGLDPGAHHRTSVLIHAANAVLLFLLLRGAVRLAPPAGLAADDATWLAALGAALFAVHPLRVESVAWVAERKDVLSAFFGLASVLAYVGWVRAPRPARFVATCALYTIGLAAKPMLVSLPLVLLLLDFWPLRRVKIVEKVPLFLLAAASCAVTIVAQRAGGALSSLDVLPLSARGANAAVSYGAYVIDFLAPGRRAVIWPHPIGGWSAGTVAASAVAFVAVTAAAVAAARRLPWLAAGWGIYAVTLVPVIGLIQVGVQARADRYTYLPHVGLVVVALWGLAALLARWSGRHLALAAALTVAIVACAGATRRGLAVWSDSETLLRRTIAVTGPNPYAHFCLSLDLAERNRLEEAASEAETAIAIEPALWPAYDHLGLALAGLGRVDEALARIEQGLRLRPDDPWAHFTKGSVLLRAGRYAEAAASLARAAELGPEIPGVFVNLAIAREHVGDTAGAETAWRRAAAADPASFEARIGLGALLARSGRDDDARAALGEARALRPENPQPLLWLATIALRRGDLEAAREIERALAPIDAAMAEAVRKDVEAAAASRK